MVCLWSLFTSSPPYPDEWLMTSLIGYCPCRQHILFYHSCQTDIGSYQWFGLTLVLRFYFRKIINWQVIKSQNRNTTYHRPWLQRPQPCTLVRTFSHAQQLPDDPTIHQWQAYVQAFLTVGDDEKWFLLIRCHANYHVALILWTRANIDTVRNLINHWPHTHHVCLSNDHGKPQFSYFLQHSCAHTTMISKTTHDGRHS